MAIAPTSLDHVALWVADREPLTALLCDARHARDRQDRRASRSSAPTRARASSPCSTPRVRASRARWPRVVLRVRVARRRRCAAGTAVAARRGGRLARRRPEGLRLGLVERPETDGATRPRPRPCCGWPTPRRPRRRSPSSASSARRRPCCASADRWVELEGGGAPEGERRCSTTSRMLVDSADAVADEAGRAGSRSPTSSTPPNTLAVFLWGPDRHQARVRRAQAELLAGLSPCRTSSSPAPGWPACARPPRRARAAPRSLVLREGRPSGRRDAALVRRRLAPPRLRRLPRASAPAGSPSSSGSCSTRLDGDLAWLEALGAPVTERGTGNPRTTGVRFDTAALTAALVRGGGRGAPRRAAARAPRRRRRSCWPRAASPATRALVREHVTPEADALLLRRRRGATGDGLRLGSRPPAPRRAPAWTSSTGAPCRRRPRASESRLRRPRPALRPPRHGHQRARGAHAARDVVGDRRRPVDRPPAGRPRVLPRGAGRAARPRVRERTVADMVAAAERAGAPVARDGDASWWRSARPSRRRSAGVRVDARAPRRAGRLGGGRRRGRRWPRAATRAGSPRRSCSGASAAADALGGALRDERSAPSFTRRDRGGAAPRRPGETATRSRRWPATCSRAWRCPTAPPATRRSPPSSSSARRPCATAGEARDALAAHPRRGARGGRVPARRRPASRGGLRGGDRARGAAALRARRRRDARADPPHAGVRAARPRRHARPRDGAARLQRAAPAPPAARGARRELARGGSGATPGSPAPATAVVQAYPGRGVPRRVRAAGTSTRRSARPPRRAAGEPRTTRTSGGTCARTRASGRSRCARWTPSPRLADVATLAALVQCLARDEAERRDPPRLDREALGWSAFVAARDGMEARLLDDDGGLRPARELAAAALGRLRPLAVELGCADALERLAGWEGGAARQRDAVARDRRCPASSSRRPTRPVVSALPGRGGLALRAARDFADRREGEARAGAAARDGPVGDDRAPGAAGGEDVGVRGVRWHPGLLGLALKTRRERRNSKYYGGSRCASSPPSPSSPRPSPPRCS